MRSKPIAENTPSRQFVNRGNLPPNSRRILFGAPQMPETRSHLINGKVIPSCFYSTEVRGGPYRRAVGNLGSSDPRPSPPGGRQGTSLARPQGCLGRRPVGAEDRSSLARSA